jgi:putative membrane protein
MHAIMKDISSIKTIFLQISCFLGLMLGVSVLFSSSFCNKSAAKSASIVNQVNDSKFSSDADRKNALILVSTAEICLREIKLAQLAQKRAKTADVKELGKMNEEFHTQKLLSVIKLAKIKSISIPTSLSIEGEKIFTELENKSEASFDEYYCDEMIYNHKQTINFFEAVYSETSDEYINAWAKNMIPDLDKQLSYAVLCQRSATK